MNKREFIKRIAGETGMSEYEVKTVVETILAEIKRVTREEGSLRLHGFGAFKLKHRKARTARNPRTGETVQVPEKHVIAFKEYS